MTVIAYRDGILAADTGGWCGDVMVSSTEVKIGRTHDGWLFGCSGKLPDIETFRAWARGGLKPQDKPRPLSNFGALTVSPSGAVIKYDAKLQTYAWSGPWAIEGCHEEFMLGALAAGLSAKDAVALAIQYCSWAGGGVMTIGLESGEVTRHG